MSKSPEALIHSESEPLAFQMELADHLDAMWQERAKLPPGFDLISMFAHSNAMSRRTVRERMGTLVLFPVGLNDTTRNSMSGGLWAFSQFPGEMRQPRENPGLISGAVSEIIRWQTR
jgi:cytochrome P450